MVEVEEKVNRSPKRNIDPSGAQSSILTQQFKEVIFSMGGTVHAESSFLMYLQLWLMYVS